MGATRPLPSESLEAVLDEARECKGAIDSIDLMLLSFPQEPSPDLCVIGFQETSRSEKVDVDGCGRPEFP